MKILIIIFLIISSNHLYSQVYETKEGAQYDGIHPEILYVIDGLKLRRPSDIIYFKINKVNIISTDTLQIEESIIKYDSLGRFGAILLFTNYPIVLNEELLVNSKEKLSKLSIVHPDQIISIEHFKRKAFFNNYGVKNKEGGCVVITKPLKAKRDD